MKTTFQLEPAISAWRASFAAASTSRAIDLDELETHLRDSFAELCARGLADEEAFHLAQRRLGGAEVGAELAKVHADAVWAERGRWMILGVLGFELLWSGLRMLAGLVQIVVMRLHLSPSGHGWLLGASTVGTIGLLAWVLARLVRGQWRPSRLFRHRSLRHPAMLAVVVGVIFCLEQAIAVVRTILAVRELDAMGLHHVFYAGRFLGTGITFFTLILLAIAGAFAQRRSEPVAD